MRSFDPPFGSSGYSYIFLLLMFMVMLNMVRRDWSVEGTAERNACHASVREDIIYHFSKEIRANIRILVFHYYSTPI
jgi:hypothetical protein